MPEDEIDSNNSYSSGYIDTCNQRQQIGNGVSDNKYKNALWIQQ